MRLKNNDNEKKEIEWSSLGSPFFFPWTTNYEISVVYLHRI